MNNKQYKNIINYSIKKIPNNIGSNSVEYVGTILKNMSIPLPQGDCKTIHKILSTGDYMFWQPCNPEDVQNVVNYSCAVVGVTDSEIFLIDNNEPNEEYTLESASPFVLTTHHLTDPYASEVSTMSYYSYNNGTTTSTNQTSIVESEDYYLNNRYFGTYLRRLCDVPNVSSGKLSILGNSIIWKIEEHKDGYYLIKVGDKTKYLSTDGSSVTLTTVTGTIPTQCRWKRSIAYGGGYCSKMYTMRAILPD